MRSKHMQSTTRELAIHYAKLSSYAYMDEKTAKPLAKELGYLKNKLISNGSAQCMIFTNKEDIVVAFRGTEPTQFKDVLADLKAWKHRSKTNGWVHVGFYDEVKKVYDDMLAYINARPTKKLYICGHSLGGGMSMVTAARLQDRVEAVYTYGCPRTGDRVWRSNCSFTHYRFVNSNDVVPKVPLKIMGYKHYGNLQYINYYGDFRNATVWQRTKDQLRARYRALCKFQFFDGLRDHVISSYLGKLEHPNFGWDSAISNDKASDDKD